MPYVLRVAVPPDVAALREQSGHGRMWARVLAELEGHVRLAAREPGRRLARRPDVWLADGHRALPDVAGPVVAQVHEAPPRDPAARALLDPTFAAHLEAAVAATVARADAIITLSYFSARDLQRDYGIAAERLHVAHLGVDPAVFQPR